jgi:hypothetical protein
MKITFFTPAERRPRLRILLPFSLTEKPRLPNGLCRTVSLKDNSLLVPGAPSGVISACDKIRFAVAGASRLLVKLVELVLLPS